MGFWERLKQQTTVRICFYLLCIVLVVGGSLGAWLGLHENASSVANEISQIDVVDVTITETNKSYSATASTTTTTSGSPNNTNLDAAFDYPSTFPPSRFQLCNVVFRTTRSSRMQLGTGFSRLG